MKGRNGYAKTRKVDFPYGKLAIVIFLGGGGNCTIRHFSDGKFYMCVKLAVWQYSSIAVKQCGSTAVWQYSSVAVQQYGSTAVQQYGSTAVWQYSSMTVQQYGSTAVRQYSSTYSSMTV